MVYHNFQSYLLIGKETDWGNAVTANKDVGLLQDLSWSPSVEWKKDYSASSTSLQQVSSGNFAINGTIDVTFQHGRLLQYLFGTVTNSNSGSDYKHVYTVNDTLPSFTMEDGYNSSSDIVYTLKGCKISSATLSMSLDGRLRMSADFAAKDVDPSGTSAGTASIDTIQTYGSWQSDLKFGTASSESSISNVQNFEITITRVAGGDPSIHGFNSRQMQAYEANQTDITFRFTAGFNSIAEVQALLGNTSGILTTANTEISSKGLVFDSKNATAWGSGQRRVLIDLSGVYLTRSTQRNSIGNYVFIDFEGFAKTIDEISTVDDITSSGSTFY
jgi:hypothetical protein